MHVDLRMKYIKWDKEIRDEDLALVGGKMLNLAILARSGFKVPKFFTVLTTAYQAILDKHRADLEPIIEELDKSNYDQLVESYLRIKDIFLKKLPKKVYAEIRQAYNNLGGDVIARSSGSHEDAEKHSFSGLHDSFSNLRSLEEVINGIQLVEASLYNPRAVQYAASTNMTLEDIASGVMRAIDCDKAGTVFTANPYTKNLDEIFIEAKFGTGEGIVDSTATPDQYIIDKRSGKITRLSVDTPRVLSNRQVRSLANLAMRAAKCLNLKYCDMEWGKEGRILWTLQARSIAGLEKKYVTSLNEYRGRSDRILGFEDLRKSEVMAPELRILTNDAFNEYKAKGMTPKIRKIIHEVFDELYQYKPLIARRAYVVEGVKNPSGLRSKPITTKRALVASVKRLWDNAIKNGYDAISNEISAFVHTMIDPSVRDAAGCITLEDGIAIIDSIYGNDEGVQSLPHDVYKVDLKTMKVIDKQIVEKRICLRAGNGEVYNRTAVPDDLIYRQTLSSREVLKLARQYKRIVDVVGNPRVEFATQNRKTYFTECAPSEVSSYQDYINTEHRAYVVREIKDARDLSQMEEGEAIFISPSIIAKRDWNLVHAVAHSLSKDSLILYPGNVRTSHNANIFRELGINVRTIGSRIYKTGDKFYCTDIGEIPL